MIVRQHPHLECFLNFSLRLGLRRSGCIGSQFIWFNGLVTDHPRSSSRRFHRRPRRITGRRLRRAASASRPMPIPEALRTRRRIRAAFVGRAGIAPRLRHQREHRAARDRAGRLHAAFRTMMRQIAIRHAAHHVEAAAGLAFVLIDRHGSRTPCRTGAMPSRIAPVDGDDFRPCPATAAHPRRPSPP